MLLGESKAAGDLTLQRCQPSLALWAKLWLAPVQRPRVWMEGSAGHAGGGAGILTSGVGRGGQTPWLTSPPGAQAPARPPCEGGVLIPWDLLVRSGGHTSTHTASVPPRTGGAVPHRLSGLEGPRIICPIVLLQAGNGAGEPLRLQIPSVFLRGPRPADSVTLVVDHHLMP